MNTNPKVYVGTYGKYNSGSIAGAWIDLAKCETYEGFLAKCKEVHKDEFDPEYMIQDYEYLPDGLSCGEWLGRKDFDDILAACKEQEGEESSFQIVDYSEKAIALTGDTKAIKEELKKLGGRFNPRLSCGPGWIFPKAKLEDVQTLIGGGVSVAKSEEEPNDYKQVFEEYLTASKSPSEKKYYVGAVRLGGGYYLLEKPHIENRFCWADEGPEYEHYLAVTSNKDALAEYFVSENLSGLNRKIKNLENLGKTIYVSQPAQRDKSVYFYEPYCSWHGPDREGDALITDEQRDILIKALTWSRELFKKRLNAYLKKYGTSKLHTWTYWRDA